MSRLHTLYRMKCVNPTDYSFWFAFKLAYKTMPTRLAIHAHKQINEHILCLDYPKH